MTNYQEFFQLSASSPQDLRNVVADYLLDQGNDSLANSMRLGFCQEKEDKRPLCYRCGDGSGSGDGFGSGSGDGFGIGNGEGSGIGSGSGNGNGSGFGHGSGDGNGSGIGNGSGYGKGSEI